jgi:hypothetical protein
MKRCILLLLLAGCSKPTDTPQGISFTEVETSIAPTVCGNADPTQIIEVNGTGLALLDYDNDSDLDLFVVNASNESCRLYENVSTTSIAFKDVTEDVGIDIRGWGTGVAVGDANGDGFDDLYITRHGSNVLLINNKGTSFSDQTSRSGIGDSGWGTSARFGDLDGDGDLDLYVCNYLEFDPKNPPPRATYKGQRVLGGPHGMTPQSNIVYENMGDGTFNDVTEAWGFSNSPAYSLNVAILDFTGDGLQDVFVGNDSMANSLFVNTGETPTRFENKGIQTGIAANGDGSMQATMGIGIADVNGNQRPDVFTTNFSSDTNTLHTNDESGFFDDRTKRFGLGLASRTLLGWTCGFHDFDLDGDEDLFIVNGHVYPEATMATIDSPRKQPVLLYERVGDRFVQRLQENTYRDRAAVFGDLDTDGDIDVIVAERHGAVRVLQNNANITDPFYVKLQGTTGNPKAIGATMRITFQDGSVVTRWLTDGSGFQSSSTPLQYVLPKGKTIIKIDIVWPNGEKQVVTEIPNEGLLTIGQ